MQDARILLVDDDQNLLDALMRAHRRSFQMVTACGAAAALDRLRTSGPFAVIVSDYTMPGMDGATFLRKAQELAPDAVRVMLTGNADVQAAANAVNQGAVFRFLRKPCEPEVFAACINVALRQHQLQQAEKQLLEQTLHGCVQVLTDVLALASPSAFGRARRVRHYVSQMVDILGQSPRWEFETAALLSQLGCISVPAEVLERAGSKQALSPAEARVLERHPAVAADLLKSIPRLESVAAAIGQQRSRFDADADLPQAARVLAVALDFEDLVQGGMTREQAVAALRARTGVYDPRCLAAAGTLQPLGADGVTQSMSVAQLRIGMVLAEDVRNEDGMLVVPKGQQITETMLARLRNYADLKSIPPRIQVHTGAEEPAAV